MNSSYLRHWRLDLGLVFGLSASAGLGYHCGSTRRQVPHKAAGIESHTAPEPQVRVHTVPLRRGELREKIRLYGEVISPPTSRHTYALPFEVSVVQIHLNEGQRINAGDVLVEVRRTSAGTATLELATQVRAEAAAQLSQVDAQLAAGTSSRDLQIAAQGRLARAELTLRSLHNAGQGKATRRILALNPGMIAHISVRAGAVVPAGEPLLEVTDRSTLAVRLFAETEDAPQIRPGLAVQISPVEPIPSPPISARVVMVSGDVDPTTRLVNVIALVDGSAPLFLNQYVQASIEIRSAVGIIAPRVSLVPNNARYSIFTITRGRAVAHPVSVGIESKDEVLIEGQRLHPGQAVVVAGAPQLKDGIAVSELP